ncbi:MAG: hypothetical protein EXS14_06825 [Planctomycetes bacterium]|nr:hypothetical protein [Planctomycetota bacterium]
MNVAGGNGAATTPSPERLTRVAIRWLSAELPAGGGGEYGATTLPLSALTEVGHRPGGFRAGLPLLVYFYSARNDDKLMSYEGTVFLDERVGFSSRFFNCLKISLDDIRDAGVRESYGGSAPTVVVLDGSGKELKRLKGWGTDAADVFKSLEVVFKEHTGKLLASVVEKEAKILQNLDRIHWDQEDLNAELKDTEDHLTKHDCERGRRELVELRVDMAKLTKEREKVIADEAKLLESLVPAAPAASGSGL